MIPLTRPIVLSIVLLLAASFATEAQDFRGLDKSPMDMAYYPDHFAHDRKPGDKAAVRVIYSRPQANGREVFGGLVPYGEVWRTGANEAPEIKFYQEVTIGDQKLPAGSYALFTVPGEDEWTVIFNKGVDDWGAYSYDEKQDVLRATASAESLDKPQEAFVIQFTPGEAEDTAVMHLAWGDTVARLPIRL